MGEESFGEGLLLGAISHYCNPDPQLAPFTVPGGRSFISSCRQKIVAPIIARSPLRTAAERRVARYGLKLAGGSRTRKWQLVGYQVQT